MSGSAPRPLPTLSELFDLEAIDAATFLGQSPTYPWGRVYGGQAVAQALVAAGRTIPDSAYVPHSLHAYFIRGGECEVPIRYEVDLIRDGRSFVTRRVVGLQADRAIMNLSASFHAPENEAQLELTTRREIVVPTDIVASAGDPSWSSFFERRAVADPGEARAATWELLLEDPSGDPLLHAAAIAYLSDDVPTEAVINAHPARPEGEYEHHETFMSASLDHAVWFHHLDATGWQLHDFRCVALQGGRGHTAGTIHHIDGTLIATVAQEVLVRHLTP